MWQISVISIFQSPFVLIRVLVLDSTSRAASSRVVKVVTVVLGIVSLIFYREKPYIKSNW